jgi:pyrimidine-nucleoside phosphorylase
MTGERMRAVEIIEKKKRGQALDAAEIEWFVDGCVSGRIPDYQASAWLMAVWFSGMQARETAALALAMAHSGDTVDLSSIPGKKVDKHSTGGVGDTTTLVAAPLAAACGLHIAKLSGRGLGHTGGTLDKLESIPGVVTARSTDSFIRIVKKTGLAVAGQSGNMTPADRMLYALRDVTATVDSMPLIAASIMSKKIAAGADAIVLDVKTGSGAFMAALEDARTLAETMVGLGREAGRETVALITDMNQPLGRSVGNGLEVAEAVEILSGKYMDGRLCRLSLEIGAEMLLLAGKAASREQGMELLSDAIRSGEGLRRFRSMVEELGGDISYLDEPEKLYQTAHVIDAAADAAGWLSGIDTREAGRAAGILGAGRETKDDRIDPAVGFVMMKELGDRVEKGEPLARFYINDEEKGKEAMQVFKASIKITKERQPVPPLIYELVQAGKV